MLGRVNNTPYGSPMHKRFGRKTRLPVCDVQLLQASIRPY